MKSFQWISPDKNRTKRSQTQRELLQVWSKKPSPLWWMKGLSVYIHGYQLVLLTLRSIGPGRGTNLVRACRAGTSPPDRLHFSYNSQKMSKIHEIWYYHTCGAACFNYKFCDTNVLLDSWVCNELIFMAKKNVEWEKLVGGKELSASLSYSRLSGQYH